LHTAWRRERDACAQARARRGRRSEDAHLVDEGRDRSLSRRFGRGRGDLLDARDPRRRLAADDQLRRSRSRVRSRLHPERVPRGGRREEASGRPRVIAAGKLAAVGERWATFDCYGTLVDWNAGIRGELERLFGAADAPRLLERYHWLEPEIESAGSMLSYREVMARVLEELGASPGERDALARSLPGWPVFPEVAGALGEAGR